MDKKRSILVSIIITLISSIGTLIAISLSTGKNVFALMPLFLHSFYREHINSIYNTSSISPYISPMSFFYIIFLLSTVLLIGISGIRKLCNKKEPFNLPNHLLAVATTLLIVFVFCQSIQQTKILGSEVRQFSNTPLWRKQAFFHPYAVTFSRFCHRLLPGKHKGMLVTDMKSFMKREQHLWLTFVGMRYYLYPLDIRPHKEKNDFLIYVLKDAGRLWVPKGFTYYPFNNISGIAIAKDILNRSKGLKEMLKNKLSSEVIETKP